MQGTRIRATVSPRLGLSSTKLRSRLGTNRSSLYQETEGAGEPVAEQVRTRSPVFLASTRAGATVFNLTCSQWLLITRDLEVDRDRSRKIKWNSILILFFALFTVFL